MHLTCLQLAKRSKDQGCSKKTHKTDNAKSYPKNGNKYMTHYNSYETLFSEKLLVYLIFFPFCLLTL